MTFVTTDNRHNRTGGIQLAPFMKTSTSNGNWGAKLSVQGKTYLPKRGQEKEAF